MQKRFLTEILNTPSVSGNEEPVQKKVLEFTKDFADHQEIDAVGNVISVVNPKADCRVLLCGHADEIGFLVTQIKDDGTVKVQRAGGVRPALYIGFPMQILHDGEKVNATVAVVNDLLKKESVSDTDLTLDIGASSKEEALKYVSVGDPVCADTTVREFLNDNFSCRALDDKTGVAVITEAAKRAKEKGAVCGIYAASTVGEETTGRGAHHAAGYAKPDCAIIVDVTWASDCAGGDPAETGSVQLGKGPVLCKSGTLNKKMNALLESIAKEKNIPYQWEVAGGRTFTDGDTVQKVGEGVPVALVSIPLRYMHSSSEVGNWRDIDNAAELISEFLLAMTKDFDYKPL